MVPDPARGIWDLASALGAPRALKDLGMDEQDIDPIAEQVVANPYANPAPVTREGVTRLLHAAWAGDAPSA